jgi:hypothetical protein
MQAEIRREDHNRFVIGSTTTQRALTVMHDWARATMPAGSA